MEVKVFEGVFVVEEVMEGVLVGELVILGVKGLMEQNGWVKKRFLTDRIKKSNKNLTI